MKRANIIAIAVLGMSPVAGAGELVDQPINPSFGGDPFNGSYLLNKAQAQDTHEPPGRSRYEPLSATERLVQNLQSRLISQLISDVGAGEISEGVFDSDEFGVVIRDENGQLSITVTDKATGDVTTINVGGLSGF